MRRCKCFLYTNFVNKLIALTRFINLIDGAIRKAREKNTLKCHLLNVQNSY